MFCSPNAKHRAAGRAPRDMQYRGHAGVAANSCRIDRTLQGEHSRNNDAGLCCIELRPWCGCVRVAGLGHQGCA